MLGFVSEVQTLKYYFDIYSNFYISIFVSWSFFVLYKYIWVFLKGLALEDNFMSPSLKLFMRLQCFVFVIVHAFTAINIL